MCGIAGILNIDGKPVVAKSIKAMCDIMTHRGPDDEGIYIDGGVGLGHRRLAIIDLTPLGHQPMTNEDGSVILTYNGEIYNFQKLKAELVALGHQFHSRTDAEVVAMSAMMTTTMLGMKKVIAMIKEKNPNVGIMLGGAPVTKDVANLFGADGYAESAGNAVTEGIKMIARLREMQK